MRPLGILQARTAWFALLVGLTVLAFWTPLTLLIRVSLRQEHYSHIPLIPLLSAVLVALDKRTIFARVETRWRAGVGMVVAGSVLAGLAHWHSAAMSESDGLSLAIAGVVLVWLGGFVGCYGLHAFRRGLYPLLFLFLIVPIPDVALDRAIAWLQAGSAEVSAWLFELAGVPVFRSGYTFVLPGVTIEVARECSGIRSSLAMLITSLFVGHLALRTGWARAALCVATIPLLVVKNGIRIVTLSLLSIYVDPGFLNGSLHQQGGIVFFGFALLLLAPVLWLLQHSEGRSSVLRPRGLSRS